MTLDTSSITADVSAENTELQMAIAEAEGMVEAAQTALDPPVDDFDADALNNALEAIKNAATAP